MKKLEYRSEQAFGSGIRTIADVLWFEIHELGNYDMLEDIRKRLSDANLIDTLNGYLIEMVEDGFVDDMSEEELKTFYQKCLNDINHSHKKKYKYCLWLAEKDTVIDYYLQNGTGYADVCAYEISDFILTDLGYDGRLYFFEKMPEATSVSIVNLEEKVRC